MALATPTKSAGPVAPSSLEFETPVKGPRPQVHDRTKEAMDASRLPPWELEYQRLLQLSADKMRAASLEWQHFVAHPDVTRVQRATVPCLGECDSRS